MLPSHRYICHQDQSSYVHASEECSPQKEYCPKNWYQIQRETEDISHDAVLEVNVSDLSIERLLSSLC